MVTSAKGILLLLFLYLTLVWTGVTYWYRQAANPASAILDAGLKFTIGGVGTLFAFVIASAVLGQWKSHRARASAKPKPEPAPAAKPQAKLPEDVLTLQALLQEAAKRLKTSSRFVRETDERLVFSGMPAYLILGAEGSGKTSAIINSGLDPELLAGQPALERSSPLSTPVANVWLAGEALLIELGGRQFTGDPARWDELLRVLAARPKVPLWQRLRKGKRQGFDLRGVIHCCDLRFFLSKPGPEQIERQSQLAQLRLRSAVKVFGKELPVYNLFTKADLIPYFREFFGRFSPQESEQVLGCTLRFERAAVEDGSAESSAVSKRLSKAFQNLYTALTEQRLSVLFQEPVAARKSKIFEFPREFNRLRQSVVEFMTQTFRSSPLEPTPINRGFYFSGTREVEPQAVSHDSSAIGLDAALEATMVFRGSADAARSGNADAELNLTRVRRGGLQTRWAFLSSLLQDVVAADRLPDSFVPSLERPAASPHSVAVIAALSIAALFGILWSISWAQNASWLEAVKAASSTPPTSQATLPTPSDLESLEHLRGAVVTLDRKALSFNWTMRMGLYSIPELQTTARDAYFKRLRSAVLDRTHSQLVRFLASVGGDSDSDGPSNKAVTDMFKAYMMMVQPGACTLETELVRRVLKAMMAEAGIVRTDPRYATAARQIDFYANEMRHGNPVQYAVNNEAKDRAVAYLGAFRSLEQFYQAMIAGIEREVQPIQLSSLTDYKRVLSAPDPDSVSGAFTPEGRTKFQAKLDSGVGSAEPCLGGMVDASAVASVQDGEKIELENWYTRDYLKAWGVFLEQFRVLPFGNAADSARRLDIFAENKSPVLGILALTAINTRFSAMQLVTPDTGITGKLKDWVQQKVLAPPPDVNFTVRDVSDGFQPVHAIASTDIQRWLTEENKPYIVALMELSSALGAISRTPGRDVAPAMYDKAREASQKARDAVKALKLKFNSTSVGLIDDRVTRLLEAPIEAVEATGITRITGGDLTEDKSNGEFREFCQSLQPVLTKYPFRSSSQAEVSLKDFEYWFAPETGQFWNRQKSFGSFTTRTEKGVWQHPQPIKDLRATPAFLRFLNAAQGLTDAFFALNGKTAAVEYAIRPRFTNPNQLSIALRLDGVNTTFDRSSFQQDYYWPARGNILAAEGVVRSTNNNTQFGLEKGAWAVFRFLGHADNVGGNRFRWNRGSDGAMLDVPVELELLYLNETNVFASSLFEGLTCPTKAVER